MPLFFRMYERFRPLRYMLGLAVFALFLSILSHAVTFIIAGLILVIFSIFWPLIVNDCFVTNNAHLPENFFPRMKLYSLPIGAYGLYMLITYLNVHLGIGLYNQEDINKVNMGIVMMWYSIGITISTGAHMINCTERTYKYILKGLK